MRSELKAILAKMIQIQEKVEDHLSDVQMGNNPNEERIEKLENEANAINEVIDILENIE